MPRISNLVPLPGVSELEALAQGFVNRLKDADLEYGKRAAVARRLERLVEHAKRPEAPAGLTSQLLEIQRQFQAADASSSRLGIRGAQRKLELWDELSARLDETMEVNMFDLLMHPHHTQTQTASTSPREWKVKVVDSYEITNQVEIRREAVWKPAANLSVQPYEIVNTSLRAGRLGSLPVAYMTFAADSENTAHELVKQELKHVSRSLHVNVAQLVGTTEGYNGLNGIIVVMEGIDFRRFDLQRRSGAVWAKCIRGFENFVASYPESREVQRITVTPDGHVTIFPFDPIHPTGGAVPTQFRKYSADGGDAAVSLLFDIYRANCFPVMESELRLFVDSLVELGLAYTELRVMGLAKSFKLFPTPRYHSFGEDWEPIPPFQPGVGEFGWATYDNGRLKDWQSLGTSRYSNVMNKIVKPSSLILWGYASSRHSTEAAGSLALFITHQTILLIFLRIFGAK